ncbi:MAG: hypothetical protein UR90_C0013G0001, partial [Parcubacteria group bacterium GW2011_GWC1_35_8]
DFLFDGGQGVDADRLSPETKIKVIKRVLAESKPYLKYMFAHTLRDDPTLLKAVGGDWNERSMCSNVWNSGVDLCWETRIGYLFGSKRQSLYSPEMAQKTPDRDEWVKSLFFISDKGCLVEVKLVSKISKGFLIEYPCLMEAKMLTDERLTELFVSHEFFFQGLLECIEAHYTARISDQEARANNMRRNRTNIRRILSLV